MTGVGFAEAEGGDGLIDVAGEVAVGEHDALGVAGGAAGVDECGEIVWGGAGEHGVEGGVR